MSGPSKFNSRKTIRWVALVSLVLGIGFVSFLSTRATSKNTATPETLTPVSRSNSQRSDPLDYLHEEMPGDKTKKK